MSNRDFTLSEYDEPCRAVVASKYKTVTLENFLQQSGGESRPILIMRHDVDQFAKCALNMAMVEHKHGIVATYYCRMTKGTYRTDIMDDIASYEHEIGYHYETLDRSQGNTERAIELFGKQLAEFRKRYPVKTVCVHEHQMPPVTLLGKSSR